MDEQGMAPRVELVQVRQRQIQLRQRQTMLRAELMRNSECLHSLEQRAGQLQRCVANESTGLEDPCIPSALPCELAYLDSDTTRDALLERMEPACEADGGSPVWTEDTTTVLIRNIPSRCTRDELLAEFPPDGSYDFLYLPYSLRQRRTCGFVIMNFLSAAAALDFKHRVDGSPLPLTLRRCKPLLVLASAVQGLKANVILAADRAVDLAQRDAFLPLVFCAGSEASLAANLYPDIVYPGGDSKALAQLNVNKLAYSFSQHVRL